MVVDALAAKLFGLSGAILCLGLLTFCLWWQCAVVFAVADLAASWVDEWSKTRARSLIGQAIYDYEVAHGARPWVALEQAVRLLYPTSVTVRGSMVLRMGPGTTATYCPFLGEMQETRKAGHNVH